MFSALATFSRALSLTRVLRRSRSTIEERERSIFGILNDHHLKAEGFLAAESRVEAKAS
jgi:hypothetical protein